MIGFSLFQIKNQKLPGVIFSWNNFLLLFYHFKMIYISMSEMKKRCIKCGIEKAYKSISGYNRSSGSPLCCKCQVEEYCYSEYRKKYWNKNKNVFEFWCLGCGELILFKTLKSIKKAVKRNKCGYCVEKEWQIKMKEEGEIISVKNKKDKKDKLIQKKINKHKEYLLRCENERTCIVCGIKQKLNKIKLKMVNFTCRSCRLKLKWKDEEYRKNHCKKVSQSIKSKWENDGEFRKKLTECQLRPEVRLSKRKKMLDNMKIGGVIPAYNINACEFIDRFNRLNNFNIQHALNGGEVEMCGFMVDGYDKGNNVIFEYDEPQHYYSNGELKDKDLERQSIILESIKSHIREPRFFRYDEKRDRLYEIITGKEVNGYGKEEKIF